MKKGVKIFIVIVVALATNFALHAAFWAGGRGHCGPQNSNHHGQYQHGGCNDQMNGAANPWGCHKSNENDSINK